MDTSFTQYVPPAYCSFLFRLVAATFKCGDILAFNEQRAISPPTVHSLDEIIGLDNFYPTQR